MFYEEQLLVPLVVFDSVLENAVRIERVLNQPMGHMLLVGESGAGKTVLSRFVAWTEGLAVFQVRGCGLRREDGRGCGLCIESPLFSLSSELRQKRGARKAIAVLFLTLMCVCVCMCTFI